MSNKKDLFCYISCTALHTKYMKTSIWFTRPPGTIIWRPA